MLDLINKPVSIP